MYPDLQSCIMLPEEQFQVRQDAAAVPAPGVESAKTKASNTKKKPKGAVPNKGGASIKPLYKEMVVDAIVTQKERLGSSLSAIKNHLISKYKIDVNQKAGALNRVLKKMREGGVLVPGAPAGRKGSGCFKLLAEEKERMTVAQRAAAKKLKAQQKSTLGKVGSKAPKKTAKKAPAKKASAAKKSATKKVSLAKKPAVKKSAAKKPAPKKMATKPKSTAKGKATN